MAHVTSQSEIKRLLEAEFLVRKYIPIQIPGKRTKYNLIFFRRFCKKGSKCTNDLCKMCHEYLSLGREKCENAHKCINLDCTLGHIYE